MLMATLLWGSSFVVTKGAADDIPIAFLIAVRMFLSTVILSIICCKSFKFINKATIFCGLILGIFYAGGMILQTYGVKYTNAGRTSFLSSASCIVTPFLEWMILKNKPKFKSLLAAMVCVVGIGLVALNERFRIDSGDLYTLAGSVCFGMELVLFSCFMKNNDGMLLNIFLIFFAGVFSAVISLFTETIPLSFSNSTIYAVLYLGIACTGIPLAFQAIAQKSLKPSVITVIIGFEAIFASVLSTLVLNETFSTKCLIGFALIFASVFVSIIEPKTTNS